jgi:hypothetical protein
MRFSGTLCPVVPGRYRSRYLCPVATALGTDTQSLLLSVLIRDPYPSSVLALATEADEIQPVLFDLEMGRSLNSLVKRLIDSDSAIFNLAALAADEVIVPRTCKLEPAKRLARLDFPNRPLIAKHPQIAVYRTQGDTRVGCLNCFIDLVRRGMSAQPLNGGDYGLPLIALSVCLRLHLERLIITVMIPDSKHF